MPRALERLLVHPALWRGGELARSKRPGVPTGYPDLDALLPGGGWPRGELAEFLVEGRGIGELALLAPALARLTQAGEAVALIAPPHLPYAPAWAARGIELSRLAVLRPSARLDALWAMEQCLRSGAFGAVLAWLEIGEAPFLRRLQLAAEAGGAFGALYNARALPASPAPLRLRLSCEGGRLRLDILKRRGAPAGALLLDIAGHALDRDPSPGPPPASPLPRGVPA